MPNQAHLVSDRHPPTRGDATILLGIVLLVVGLLIPQVHVLTPIGPHWY